MHNSCMLLMNKAVDREVFCLSEACIICSELIFESPISPDLVPFCHYVLLFYINQKNRE